MKKYIVEHIALHSGYTGRTKVFSTPNIEDARTALKDILMTHGVMNTPECVVFSNIVPVNSDYTFNLQHDIQLLVNFDEVDQ